ncbi:hypothetical protein SDC9_83360 [bioreactor metagenome]|uniref:Lysyltransferase n=1 Tax=bioreactor metagenome TaxID=1076179 RepID=A0A644Z8Z8_9ZZZZ|nr:lysylphosphatidylglycerol synthase transmembrane domain-containing protein [Oscillospiraceae bacterium]
MTDPDKSLKTKAASLDIICPDKETENPAAETEKNKNIKNSYINIDTDKNSNSETNADNPPKQNKRTRNISIIVFAVINAIVICYTASNEFTGEKVSAEAFSKIRINVFFILIAIGCIVVSIAAQTAKYVLMMKKLTGSFSIKTSYEVAVLGKYYDNLTPSGIGGQPFQIFYLKKSGVPTGASAAMPTAGFMSMQAAFAIVAVLAFIFKNSVIDSVAVKIAAYFGILLYLFIPCVILLFTLAPSFTERAVGSIIKFCKKLRIVKNEEHSRETAISTLREYREGIRYLLSKRSVWVGVLACDILYHIAILSVPYFVIIAFGGQVALFDAFSASAFIYAAITFIPTPGNCGAAEGSFYIMFSSLTKGYIFWAMLVWRVLTYYSFIFLGLLVYFGKTIKKYTDSHT